jgi:DNA repair exonuclease SbcCD ATPase subunit
MIILEELSWFNMFGYGPDNKIKLNKDKITQLIGNNGQGKTTVSYVLQELLYSKNIKNVKKTDIKNRYIADTSWGGEVKFSVDNDKYVVSVNRKGAITKVKLLKNGQDISEHKVPDTYKKIKEVLGDYEVFCPLTYQSSKNMLAFIEATDTARKNFLITLFNLTRYVNIGEVVKLKLTEVEREYLLKQQELNIALSFLNENKIPNKLESIKVTELDDKLIEKRAELEKSIEIHDDLCRKIDKNNLLIKERNGLSFDMGMQEPDKLAIETLKAKILDYTSRLHTKNDTIQQLNKRIKTYQTADKCYACGQSIDNSVVLSMKEQDTLNLQKLRAEYNDFSDEYEILTAERNASQQKIDAFNDNKRKIERFEQLTQLIDTTLRTDYPDISSLKLEFTSISDIITKLKAQREKDLRYNEQVAVNNTKVDAYIEQKRNFLAKKEILETELAVLKTRVTRLNILKKAFSTTGLVAFKLENVTKALEETINLYLVELSDGQFQIIFRLEGEKLNIIVRSEGLESPIECLSGGEYNRVQFAILFSIRSVLTKISGNSVNLLFLDEIDGTLDSIGKEKLIELLQNEPNLNVFLISHSFTHPLIEKIEIHKEGKISKILN